MIRADWNTPQTRDFVAKVARIVEVTGSDIASGLNRAMTTVRSPIIVQIVKDTNLSKKDLKKDLGSLRRAAPGRLQAIWTIKGLDHRIRAEGGGVPDVARGASATVSSYDVTGGSSVGLTLARPFTFTSKDGGKVIAIRLQHGKGTHRGGSQSYRAVYAERATKSMSPGYAGRKLWDDLAPKTEAAVLGQALAAAIQGEPFSEGRIAEDVMSGS